MLGRTTAGGSVGCAAKGVLTVGVVALVKDARGDVQSGPTWSLTTRGHSLVE